MMFTDQHRQTRVNILPLPTCGGGKFHHFHFLTDSNGVSSVCHQQIPVKLSRVFELYSVYCEVDTHAIDGLDAVKYFMPSSVYLSIPCLLLT